MAWAIGTIAALTFLSGAVVALMMREKVHGALNVTQSPELNVRVQTSLTDSYTIASQPADTKS
jgi:hypothetical protein